MNETAGRDNEDRSDQLSPNRALHESTWATGSQRIGNNGPLANPTVSIPEGPAKEEAGGDRTGV
jgi:hypothetical protein